MKIRTIAAALALACLSVNASAQAWPAKPVRLVLGFPPGSAPDTITRLLADKFTAQIGQTFIVDNRPGAAATIAATQVAQSPADGYTIMVALAASMATAVHLLPSAKYHPVKDFAPIGFIQRGPYYIAVPADSAINSFPDLLAAAKAKPGEINYASPGVGTQHHLTWELIQLQTGTKLTHVPLSGTAVMLTETITGRTHVNLDGAGVQFASQVKAGKLKLVGMTGARPLPIFPGIRPIREQGLDLLSHSWWGLVAPAGTPREIITRMNTELNKALASSDVIDRLSAEGAITDGTPGSTPEEFGKWIQTEYERWGKVIKDVGLKLN